MLKKNQTRIAEQDLPDIKQGVSACRVGIARGGSQFEVWDGESTWLTELPKRFRNNIWIRRGSFVLVDTGNGSSNASGIRGEIVFVLQKEHISQLKKQDHWPSKLEETRDVAKTSEVKGEGQPRRGISDEPEEGSNTDGSSDSELFQNNNRR